MGPRVTRNREKLRYFVYNLLGEFGAKVILLQVSFCISYVLLGVIIVSYTALNIPEMLFSY